MEEGRAGALPSSFPHLCTLATHIHVNTYLDDTFKKVVFNVTHLGVVDYTKLLVQLTFYFPKMERKKEVGVNYIDFSKLKSGNPNGEKVKVTIRLTKVN